MTTDRDIPAEFTRTRNCAVRERTADGVSVGRCWYALDERGFCPRHGDVREQMAEYVKTGRLFEDPRDKGSQQ